MSAPRRPRVPRLLVWAFVASPLLAWVHLWLWPLAAAALEVLFYFYLTHARSRHQLIDDSHAPPHETEETVGGILAFADMSGWTQEDFRHWVAGWFQLPADRFHDIRYGNACEWIAWGLFNKYPAELTPQEAESMRQHIETIATRCGTPFPDGHNPEVLPMRHTLDPVQSQHRPLAFYALLRLVRLGAVGLLWLQGFRWRRAHGIRCMVRKGDPGSVPVVLLHGLGLGIINQVPIALELARADRRRPVVVVETPEIAMLCNDGVTSLEHLAGALRAFVSDPSGPLGQSALGRAVFMGHSYGSAQLAWLVKRAPEVVAGCVFVDPICFLLFLPGVSRNCIYLPPEHLSIVQNFIRREPVTAHCLSRHFWWYGMNLFAECLPQDACSVVLAGKDGFCPVDQVQRYLANYPSIEVHRHDHLTHGDAVFEASARGGVARALLRHAAKAEFRSPSVGRPSAAAMSLL
eukprot:TRINITY_DN47737_c0_g1_i1.p1 TRINITY_DN47737_c0_g1~~TRINITY_DN47737_c0_g1_i1.p1  ORF type:complete len:490 (+),score=137.41 TRINITY_DN47737_c0_g1_i1:85-1470(+)